MIKKIITIIEWVIFLAVFATFFVVISPLLPTKKYFSTYIVPTGSMEPYIKAGSVAVVVPANEIKKDDVIAFTSPDNQKLTILHRVVEISDKGYKTKGDNNNSVDNWVVPTVFVKGKLFYIIPYLGHPAALAKTPTGFALIVGLPALLLVILQFKKIREGIEEEVKKRVEKQTKNLPVNLLLIALSTSLVLASSVIPVAHAQYFSKATVSNVAFSVKDFVPPPVPTLLSPANGTIRNTSGMIMDWSDVLDYGNMHNPVYYIYQSALNSGFSPLAYQSVHLSSSFIPAPGTPDGTYWWRVKACDSIDNCSDWSAPWTVTVDNIAPDTVIDSGPAASTTDTTAAFVFHATETGSTFQCQLDGGAFAACTTPQNYSGLSVGSHTFNVKATDLAGNTDPTPASWTWTINSPPASASAGDVVINEVMWMGSTQSSADEWIELRNTRNYLIDISNWRIDNAVSGHGHLEIPAGNSIPALGYFLIANYDANNSHSALSVQNDRKDTNLSLNDNYQQNGALVLKDAGQNIIDSTPTATSASWPAGVNSGTLHQSMERNSDPASGWHTCLDVGCTSVSYWDSASTNYGTPKDLNLSPNDPSATASAATVVPVLEVTNDTKSLSFVVKNVSGFKSLSYQLTYDSDQAPQGVTGKADLSGATDYKKDGILFGTCSTGGTCTYNTGVKNIHLKVDLTDKDGKVTTLEKTI